MSAIKYPDTPNGRRERRAKILELKEKIRKKNDLLRVINETYSNLGELYPRMTEATDGKVPIIPLIIARSIWMNQKPQVTAFLKEQWAKTERQKSILEKLESSEPLDEFLKEAILQAVYKFDTDFLESLVKAIHLVKSDDFHNSNVVQVISCHEVFRRLHQENPTNRKLLELLNEISPNLRIEERTLRDICKRWSLPLVPDVRGRPKKKGK
jgi:hypothetical protein